MPQKRPSVRSRTHGVTMRQVTEAELAGVERRPVATIAPEPDEIARLAAITFAAAVEEGLGPLVWAAVEAGGVYFILNRYELAAHPGTEVLVAAADAANAEAFAALLAGLGLTAGAVTWRGDW